jgi:hypothetical protein
METLRRTACARNRSGAARGSVGIKSQKIAVVGAGATSRHGPDLVRAGLDATFIEQWPAHAEAMRTNGVWVVMPDETLVTPVRGVHSGGSGGLDEGPPRRRRRHQRPSSCGSSAASAAARP